MDIINIINSINEFFGVPVKLNADRHPGYKFVLIKQLLNEKANSTMHVLRSNHGTVGAG